jgi:hypothetical protein
MHKTPPWAWKHAVALKVAWVNITVADPARWLCLISHRWQIKALRRMMPIVHIICDKILHGKRGQGWVLALAEIRPDENVLCAVGVKLSQLETFVVFIIGCSSNNSVIVAVMTCYVTVIVLNVSAFSFIPVRFESISFRWIHISKEQYIYIF